MRQPVQVFTKEQVDAVKAEYVRRGGVLPAIETLAVGIDSKEVKDIREPKGGEAIVINNDEEVRQPVQIFTREQVNAAIAARVDALRKNHLANGDN